MSRTTTQNRLRSSFNNRQYMVSRDFEIYYYSDTDMKNVDVHTHDYYEFYFFLDGDVSLTVGENSWHLLPGDIILIPPHTRHKLTVNTPEKAYRRFIFWITMNYCAKLMELSPDYGYILQHASVCQEYIYHLDLMSFNTVRGKVMNLLEELYSNRFGRDAKISLCVNDLMLFLNRNIYELKNSASEGEMTDLCENLITYLNEHISEEITLDQLAAEFYVSKYHISHVFKEQMGISLHQFLLKKRLRLCKDAILSGTEITTAYLQYGFGDYSSFYRAFKKTYGMSPKEYLVTNRIELK